MLCYGAEVKVRIYSSNTRPLEEREREESLEEDRTPKDDFTVSLSPLFQMKLGTHDSSQQLFEQVDRLFLSVIERHVSDSQVISEELVISHTRAHACVHRLILRTLYRGVVSSISTMTLLICAP